MLNSASAAARRAGDGERHVAAAAAACVRKTRVLAVRPAAVATAADAVRRHASLAAPGAAHLPLVVLGQEVVGLVAAGDAPARRLMVS
jgi:hypothetical protein